MKLPHNLIEGDTIGICAPSDGLSKEADFLRLENAKLNLEEKGYSILESASVRHSVKGRSASAEIRAKEFMDLVQNPDVKYIVSATGGDFLMEILPFLDFETIAKNPKWIQGYSDNTGLLFPITTKTGIPTVYAGNIGDYGMADWHQAVKNNLSILEGVLFSQKNFNLYETSFHEKVTGVEGYRLEEKVCYRLLGEEKEAKFSGRLLGGCLDVLINLCGTRFDEVNTYVRKQASEGILWYMESFALSSARLEMALLQLKEAGWFYGAKGFLFGRPCFFNEEYGTSFEEAVFQTLGGMGLPIITGCDIGHRPPRLTMINGKMAEVIMTENNFTLTYRKEEG